MTESEQYNIFKSWIDRYQSLMFKVVRAYAYTPDDQDDLFQEISIQAWQSIPGFRGESSESTWLYRISINTALKWVRKERKHRDGHSGLEGSEHLLSEKSEKSNDQLDWLYSEIAKLNRVDRSITLLLLDGFSYKEMSEILGISETNIGVKIHRIKKHLIKQTDNGPEYGI